MQRARRCPLYALPHVPGLRGNLTFASCSDQGGQWRAVTIGNECNTYIEADSSSPKNGRAVTPPRRLGAPPIIERKFLLSNTAMFDSNRSPINSETFSPPLLGAEIQLILNEQRTNRSEA